MRDNGALSRDVNLHELAANTTRFSGAEIAGVVRAAASFALEKQVMWCDMLKLLCSLSSFSNLI